jgi:hypothetical protein
MGGISGYPNARERIANEDHLTKSLQLVFMREHKILIYRGFKGGEGFIDRVIRPRRLNAFALKSLYYPRRIQLQS